MIYNFRKATKADVTQIWSILQQAVIRRKNEGSNQWQDGYPNLATVENDLKKDAGYVLVDQETIIAYFAVLKNDEPEYEKIEGNWLTDGDFMVIHRIAVAEKYLRKGLAKIIFSFIERLAIKNNIFSIKVDTNYDNVAMLKLFEKLEYTYCGRVYFRGSERKAYEKVLKEERRQESEEDLDKRKLR